MSQHVHHSADEARPLTQRPVLFDGCEECDARAEDPLAGLCRLDQGHFIAAWNRMAAVEYGLDPGGYGDHYLSTNEKRLCHALYLTSILLQRHPGVMRSLSG